MRPRRGAQTNGIFGLRYHVISPSIGVYERGCFVNWVGGLTGAQIFNGEQLLPGTLDWACDLMKGLSLVERHRSGV
jgi:hypothetical protein